MNTETAKILCELNNAFYRKHHASFSKTREAPWPGWRRCLEVVEGRFKQQDSEQDYRLGEGMTRFSVFDLACGNLRFETFLSAEFPEADISFYAVDNCEGLVPQTPVVQFQSLDILDILLKGLRLQDLITAPRCDLSVCFGFMHHVPLVSQREEILANLIAQTRSGGYVFASFWQFLNNEALASKAHATHERALKELGLENMRGDLGSNDLLLGWENKPGAYRYCHSFSESEIDELVGSIDGKATLVSRFVSDGRTNDLNSYLVLQVS
ncbi:MAG: class I SAM-dependent methyltransferase [Coriobacteriia bacterium]|nr:class I SAM-dependent methyltransferase [Coriobacteriia bacterium]